ncbi:hypothetical protein [Streptomyces sp. cg35]|uniref:hypothetical protein n=1 Tax=Streptomyces sp. cg35 TaxID=3421650 RepID=UPI003D172994
MTEEQLRGVLAAMGAPVHSAPEGPWDEPTVLYVHGLLSVLMELRITSALEHASMPDELALKTFIAGVDSGALRQSRRYVSTVLCDRLPRQAAEALCLVDPSFPAAAAIREGLHLATLGAGLAAALLDDEPVSDDLRGQILNDVHTSLEGIRSAVVQMRTDLLMHGKDGPGVPD